MKRVKANTNSLKIVVADNQTEPAKFKLMNSGESILFKIVSKKGTTYQSETLSGTLLKKNLIEISLDLSNITPDIFTSDDLISIFIYDKESSICIQSIELPLKVVATTSKYQTISSTRSPSHLDSPIIRQRNRTAAYDDPFSSVSATRRELPVQSETQSSVIKKTMFIVVCSICVILIVLPLRGYPLNEPHHLDNWVNHLARYLPENVLPNHLIQYLAILILGAVLALFVFQY